VFATATAHVKVNVIILHSGVARMRSEEGKAGDYVMGHSRRTSGPDAADSSMTNSSVTNAVLIERAMSC